MKVDFNMYRTGCLQILSLALLLLAGSAWPQTNSAQYVHPLPGTRFATVDTKIVIRPGDSLAPASLSATGILVTGSVSGPHTGTIRLARDEKTIVFNPDQVFTPGEKVTVHLSGRLRTASGGDIAPSTFSFYTCNSQPFETQDAETTAKKSKNNVTQAIPASPAALPADFPTLTIDKQGTTAPGYLFLSFYPYLIIVDNDGTPVFYRKIIGTVYDFKMQPNGKLTYFVYPVNSFGMNSSMIISDTYTTTSGYSVDVHDLRVKDDGGYYIFGKRLVTMDLSNVVSGGLTNAQIIDGALQEFDASGNLLFAWDALDHYAITDVDPQISLAATQIDFSHFNSLEPDTDGNLILSARNLDEVTKIDHATGKIIWRFGGKYNQFTFLNDPLGFSRQHDVRRISNGDLTMFDNGVFHPVAASSMIEYKLDEKNMTATLVRRFTHNNTIYSEAEGSVQELPNGNFLIGWGNVSRPALTEITPDDSIIYELGTTTAVDEYRGFRFTWKTGYFTTDTNSLFFIAVDTGSSLTQSVRLFNAQTQPITISEIYCKDSTFFSTATLPITIQPGTSVSVPVTFAPSHSGYYQAVINFRVYSSFNNAQQLIARQVQLTGTTSDIRGVEAPSPKPKAFTLLQNYPNPFNPSTAISYAVPKTSTVYVRVYDILGRLVKTLVNAQLSPGNYATVWNGMNDEGQRVGSGIYFYTLEAGSFRTMKKMLLLK
jgi:hypothetical protein